jgi:hypothetical protein
MQLTKIIYAYPQLVNSQGWFQIISSLVRLRQSPENTVIQWKWRIETIENLKHSGFYMYHQIQR